MSMSTDPPGAPRTRGSQRKHVDATRRSWMSQFDLAFALMSVIPLLISCYLITVRLFSIEILAGYNGVFFFLAVVMALIGLLAGRQSLERIISQLIEANEKLARFNTMQGEFVSHVAHELRSPLAIMKGALDNLRDGLYGSLTAEQAEPITISQNEVTRLKRIVGDLLDIGHIEVGKLSLSASQLNLQDVLRSVAQSCGGLMKARCLQLDMDVPAAPVTVWADRDRLVQVFMNVLSNAIKFTARGGVRVHLTQDDREARVEVADTGRGIASEDVKRLFVKFERVGANDQEGSGLGLAIAKAIVELHGGRIWVESELGRGSRFFIHLPKRRKDASEEASAGDHGSTTVMQ